MCNENKLVIFESEDKEVSFKVNVDAKQNTVWLNLNEITELFESSKQNISYHLKNIYKENELEEKATIKEILTVQKEGNREVKRSIAFYNLDTIISIGYRVNSRRATYFRQWATKQLRDLLLEGYVLNQKRLAEKDMEVKTLKTGIQILSTTLKDHIKTLEEAKGLTVLLDQFDKGLTLLDDYDHESLDKKGRTIEDVFHIKPTEYAPLIDAMRTEFTSDIFGQEKDNSFNSAVNQVHQTFQGEDLYPSLEEKAATLLYLVIKNHAFVDGNKRIAAACFVYFLERNGFNTQKHISNDALATLTLFIAASKAEDMKVVIRLAISILNRSHKP